MANEFVAVINGYKVKDSVARTKADQAVSEVLQMRTAVNSIKTDVESLKENASEGVDTESVDNIIETHIDKTLTLDNKLADAKAVGDKIKETKAELEAKIVLPVATPSTLGGVKVGAGLVVAEDGTISATGEGGVADSVQWENVVGKPSTFTPAPHTHTWEQLGDKPETFPPSSHTHTPEEVGALPASYTPPVTSVNGQTGAVTIDIPEVPDFSEVVYDPLAPYPIGSLYWNRNNTSPASLFGGQWSQISDVFIFACSTDHPSGETGGAESVTLTVDNIPAHTHEVWGWKRSAAKGSSAAASVDTETGDGAAVAYNRNTGDNPTGITGGCVTPVVETGGGLSHNNMPPYIAMYCWERIA